MCVNYFFTSLIEIAKKVTMWLELGIGSNIPLGSMVTPNIHIFSQSPVPIFPLRKKINSLTEIFFIFPKFFFCFLENFHLLQGPSRTHIPQDLVLDSLSTIQVWSPSHGGFIFFFWFMPKNRPFSDFPIFLALWPPPKFWVLEVRVQNPGGS